MRHFCSLLLAIAVPLLAGTAQADLIGIPISQNATVPSGTFDDTAEGTFADPYVIAGAGGHDLWGGANVESIFQVYDDGKVSGDFEIFARARIDVNGGGWSRAGLVIRETLDTTSTVFAASISTDSGGRLTAGHRDATGGGFHRHEPDFFPDPDSLGPFWLKIIRVGDVFESLYSEMDTDNPAAVNDWTRIGTGTDAERTVVMSPDVYIGFQAHGRNNNNTDVTTASFWNLGGALTQSDGDLNSIATGFWDAAGTWAGTVVGSVPTELSLVTIDDTDAVTVRNATSVGRQVTLEDAGSLVIQAGRTLTIGTAVNVDSTATTGVDILGTLEAGSLNLDAGTVAIRNGGLLHSTGSANLAGGALTIAGSGQLSVGTTPSGSNPVEVTPGGTLTVVGGMAIPGTVDLAGGTIKFEGTAGTWHSGLQYGLLPGNLNAADPNPGTSVTFDLAETETGIPGNTTKVFTGQFHEDDGFVEFTEHVDDKVRLWIDGNPVLNNDSWNTRTYSGDLGLTPGWHDFELRLSNGGGGSGPIADEGFGFAYDPDALSGDFYPSNYVHPEDPGDGSLFRHFILDPLDRSTTNFVATADGSVIETNTETNFGTLTLDKNGTVTTQGSPITFTGGTTIASGAVTVGIDPQVATTYGTIDGSAAATPFVFSKVGPSDMTFRPGGDNQLANMGQATIDAAGGTLTMVGAAAWGGATKARLSGGTLEVVGDLEVPADPGLVTTGLVARFDAGAITGLVDGQQVQTWVDSSGNFNDATLDRGAPTYVASVPGLGGEAAVRFPDAGDSALRFPQISDVRTLIAVARDSDTDTDFRFLMASEDGSPDFHAGNNGVIFGVWAMPDVQNGTTRINGDEVDAHVEKWPTDHSVMSFEPVGDAAFRLTQIGNDRGYNDRGWRGDIADVLIYNVALTEEEVQQATLHLMHRYGLGAAQAIAMTGTSFAVEEDSTLKATTAYDATFGGLTLDNGILTTAGSATSISFSSTTIAGTSVGINATVPTDLGPIDGGGLGATIAVQNDLALGSPATNMTGSTFDAQAGILTGYHDGTVNPFGDATLKPSGGKVLLSAKPSVAGGSVDYANAIEAAGGVISAGPGSAGHAGPMTVNVTGDVNLSGDVELKSETGYTLNVGTVTGNGAVTIDTGIVTLAGANSTVGTLTVSGGVADTAGNDVGIGVEVKLAEVKYGISGGSLAVRGSDLLNDATLTVGGGVLTMRGPPGLSARVVSVNFATTRAGGPHDVTRSAGVVEVGNWNNMLPNADGGPEVLIDSDGVTTAATVTWDAGPPWDTGTAIDDMDADDNDRLMKGYLDYGGNGAGQTITVDFAEIPFDDYDVYLYHDSSTDDRTMSLSLDGGVTKLFSKEYPGSFDGTFVLDQHNTLAEAVAGGGGNYFLLEGMTGPTLKLLTMGEGTGTIRSPVQGVQIVERLSGVLEQPTTNLLVTANTTIDSASSEVTVGSLTVQPGVTSLDLQGALYSFQNARIADGATVVGEMAVRGTLDVGNGVGEMTINEGELVFDNSDSTAAYNAEVSLGGSAASITADKIVVTAASAIHLDGTLAPKGIGRTSAGFFAAGTSLTVVNNTAGGVLTGVAGDTPFEFATVDPAPAADKSAHIGQGAFLRDVIYDRTGGFVTRVVDLDVFVALGGDTDGDKKVWLSDWAALRAHFGNTATDKTWTEGNFDPWVDGKVWLSDWAALRANFGNADYTIAEAGAAAVPEPGTIAMLLAGLIGLALFGRRRRRA